MKTNCKLECMKFNGQFYTRVNELDIFEFISNSTINEYMQYGNKFIFHTADGFFAAYVNDLSNYYDI